MERDHCAVCHEIHAAWTMVRADGLPRGEWVCEWCAAALEDEREDRERDWERRHEHDELRGW